jgi:hypothetical protein
LVIVTWTSSADNGWCSLDAVRLAGLHMTGVFLIWYSGNPGRVVCVGRGDIAEQLTAARRDEAVQGFRSRGTLLVTWAKVSAQRIDGIERYLAETWSPLLERKRSDAAAIEVNSPGWMRAFV